MEIKVEGLGEIEALLKQMPDEFNYKFLTESFQQVLKKVFIPEAKLRAPMLGGSKTTEGMTKVVSRKYASRTHDKGNLRNSLNVGRVKSARKNAAVWGGVQASQFGKKRYDAYYAHMVEFGHFVKMKKGYGKWVPPDPFIRPAYDATKDRMKDMILDIMRKRFEGTVKRYSRTIVKRNANR